MTIQRLTPSENDGSNTDHDVDNGEQLITVTILQIMMKTTILLMTLMEMMRA